MTIVFRPALIDDEEVGVPLIFASGPAAFRYVFSVDYEDQALDFLAYSFKRGSGEFGCDNHIVMEHDGEVVAIGAWWHNGNNSAFMLSAICHIVAFYGLRRAAGVMIRGLKIESVIKPPRKDVVCIGHIGVLPSMRGQSLGARLMNHLVNLVKDAGFTVASLDVAETNPAAHQLYERLGYIEVAFNEKDLRSKFGQICGHSYMELKLT
ncbi:MAG: ribosomal protein S18 acetylase RimI-like enzyme [Pseudomonadales bacterium]|jgi:ribosomal protein S18 acetylase RimI-like enzyme